jgi:hypothetical protein
MIMERSVEKLTDKIREETQKPNSNFGKLPEKGLQFEMNGLRYEVTYVDKALGKFHARLARPKKKKKKKGGNHG